VEIALNVKGVYAERLTGAGFGGSEVALVQLEAAVDLTDAIAERYEQCPVDMQPSMSVRRLRGYRKLQIKPNQDKPEKMS
jgi:galactokinase